MKKTPTPYTIVYQDDAILIVDKAPGLAVLAGRGRTESLLTLLEADKRVTLPAEPLPPPPPPAGQSEASSADDSDDLPVLSPHRSLMVIHRIDAETSGILMFAKTRDAMKALGDQFRLRLIKKEYWALVRGTPLQESGSVDLPIGVDPKDKTRMIIRGNDAKKCRTKWVAGQRFAGVTLLKVYPVTGRRHQIRVHLKAMGYPLAVDPLYGGKADTKGKGDEEGGESGGLKLSEFKRHYKTGKFQEERPLMNRLTLHARSLTFVHPTTGVEMTIEAPLPKDFRGTLEALEKWARKV